ncbi:MAG: hypothetical protein KKH98_07940 [Spirochaetes bacterium]|nr:hypothetical protein [Spirochaetota bacterium]
MMIYGRISLVILLVTAVFLSGCEKHPGKYWNGRGSAVKGGSMNYIETFKIPACEKIVLESYKKMSDSRDGKAPKVREITDKDVLKKILALMNELPDKGEEMIKMGDVPIINVVLFIGHDKAVYFTFYQDMVKTPDTSFYSEAPAQEKELYDLLVSFL